MDTILLLHLLFMGFSWMLLGMTFNEVIMHKGGIFNAPIRVEREDSKPMSGVSSCTRMQGEQLPLQPIIHQKATEEANP